MTLLNILGHTIHSGPFAGLHWSAENPNLHPAPKILGTHELELHETVETLLGAGHDRVLDLSDGDGYYAIGFAARLPEADIIAFEPTVPGRERIAALARKNHLSHRIDVRGACDARRLNVYLDGARKPLVLVDAEGSERDILDPACAPNLHHATILAEIHDATNPGIGALVKERFFPTHRIREIWSRPRSHTDIPLRRGRLLARTLKGQADKLLDEGRPAKMRWFLMSPRPADARPSSRAAELPISEPASLRRALSA